MKQIELPIQNIELIRKAKNVSRESVAKKLGINLSAYGKIERGEIKLTVERLYELATIFHMEPEQILTYNKSKKGNVSYVPIETQAVFLTGNSQKDSEYKTYNLPFIEGKNLYVIDAMEDSMYPTISPGDYIVIEKIEDKKTIQYGRPYVVVGKEGPVIKRVHSNESQKKYTLKSDNTMYEPYEINKNDVISIWLVRNYLLRTNLAPRSPITFNENTVVQATKKTSK